MTDIESKPSGGLAPMPAEWTYAPAPESRDVVSLRDSYGLFVGGEWIEPRSGEHFTTIAPGSEEPLGEVAQAGPEDVALAVAAAREAFGAWSALPGSERAKYLFRIARILQERSREFAVLESLNGGKPIRSRATSTCRSRPRTSSTTRAGPTSSSTRSRTARRSRSVSRARSSRGTSRC